MFDKKMHNLSGYWIGEIKGTNLGGFTLDITQKESSLEGLAKLCEPTLGTYELNISGNVSDKVELRLTPGHNPYGLQIGNIRVSANIIDENTISGRWRSDTGTEGIFEANRVDETEARKSLPKSNSVFLVHGHDEGAMHAAARYLEKLGVEPVILQEQISQGMTVIEKFEDFANRAGFAVVLMTPDDYGYPQNREEQKKARPRQNVLLELGFFAACLGRDKTLVLTKGDIELPSDILGLVYEKMDVGESWKIRLGRELKAAGYEVDLNAALS